MVYESREKFDEYGQYYDYYQDISKNIEDTLKLVIQNDPNSIPFPKDANTKSEIKAVQSLVGRCNKLCKSNDDVFACNPYGECQLNFRYADSDDMIYAAKEYRSIIQKWQNYNNDIDGILRCSSKKKTCEYKPYEVYTSASIEEEQRVLREEERQQQLVRDILSKKN